MNKNRNITINLQTLKYLCLMMDEWIRSKRYEALAVDKINYGDKNIWIFEALGK